MSTEYGPLPTSPAGRLALIATLLGPCPAPDIAHGHVVCPCGYESAWPCPATKAAWIAQGRNPDDEIHQAVTEAYAAMQRLDR